MITIGAGAISYNVIVDSRAHVGSGSDNSNRISTDSLDANGQVKRYLSEGPPSYPQESTERKPPTPLER